MACYAAVASLMNLLNDILRHHRYKDLGFGRLANMESLFVKVNTLQGLLRDQSSKCSKATDDVHSKIRDVTYEAQDVIQYEIRRLLTIDTHQLMLKKISQDFIEDSLRLEQLIASLAKDIMAIEQEQTSEESEQLVHDSSSASDPSCAGENMMIGFDAYLIKIKEDLCGRSSKLLVIPIVGMGGIGKTTLARNAFNDSVIVYHFDYRGWVTISQDYHLDRVLHNLMMSLHLNELDDEAPQEVIYKYLKGRRYLIVIDDIWGTNVWDDLKWIFPDDHNGSRILLTSRLGEVACYSETLVDSHHQIQFLNENDSWNLLQEKVFAREHCSPELEDTGKLIAKKCRGLPLAIVVIAGILSNVRTQYHWRETERNMSVNLGGNYNFSNLLLLSYNHLPHHLKACFLYIGSFPQDHEINISRLINLWIAEGFIKLGNTSKSVEEVAEECVQDLVQRNLILVTKRKSSGKFKCCVMHDLLREFCKQQALEEQFFQLKIGKGKNNLSSASVRWINYQASVDYDEPACSQWWTSNMINRSLRCIIWFGDYIEDFDNLFGGFRLLEILDLLDVDRWDNQFPEVVFELIHLKLLALAVDVESFSIPPSISKLLNLQTFIMPYTEDIKFPNEVWDMSQMKRLEIRRMKLPISPCIVAKGGLENLQTLSTVEGFIFTDDTIRMIPNLKRLKIRYYCFEPKNEWNLYGLYRLAHLCMLEVLSISFRLKYYIVPLPENFTFPLSLKKLCLAGTRLPWKDLAVVGLLPNLTVLKLRWLSMEGDEWEPVEGEFLRLEFLLLQSLSLKYWRADNTHFPCLKHITVRNCQDLVEIPLEIGDIPTLTLIDIHRSKGVEESALKIREEQESMGNNVQVRINDDTYLR